MELKKLSLKQQNDTLLYVLDKNDITEDFIANKKRKLIFIEQEISIADYKTIDGSFDMDIICDSEIAEKIKEKVVLDTDYVEENDSVWEVMASQ